MLVSQPQIENLHKRLTDRIKFSEPPDETTQFVKATPDAINKGTIDDEGNKLPTPFWMHVDNNLTAERRQFMVRAVAASIKALCQILGKPEEHCR